jgi:hypothetical protein
VRLIPPSYVKPYVKRLKNDAADSEAICEAVTWPTMRFVEMKSLERQSVMVLHRVRLLSASCYRTRSAPHKAEFGVAAPLGRPPGARDFGRASAVESSITGLCRDRWTSGRGGQFKLAWRWRNFGHSHSKRGMVLRAQVSSSVST